MKRILLFGATGMAGHMVYYFLRKTNKYNIDNVVFRNRLNEDSIVLDVTSNDAVSDLVRAIRPDIIINCIGVLVRGSNEHPDNAILLNAYFPHLLKRLSDDVNAKLIHISTDCVFSGKKGNYSENDIRDADDVYGRSKALGEIINDKDLTIRTSIIGPELKENGEGLFHWFMKNSGDINGYTEAYWGGVTTLELAKTIDVTIDQNVTGLVHLTNGEKISKFDLLNLFKMIWKKNDIKVNPYNGKCVDKSLQKSNKFNFKVPAYPEMMFQLDEWMKNNENLYFTIYG